MHMPCTSGVAHRVWKVTGKGSEKLTVERNDAWARIGTPLTRHMRVEDDSLLGKKTKLKGLK